MTRIARISAAAALLAGVAAAGITAAQDAPDGPPPGGPMMSGSPMLMMGRMIGREGLDFAAIDTDGNGSLSRAELVAFATGRLAKADTNGDGTLTRVEVIEALPGPHGGLVNLFAPDPAEAFADRMLATLGATEAGQVTVADLAGQRVNFLLAFADTDRDAAISQAEADALRDRARAHRHGPRHGMDRPGPEARGPGGPDAPGPQDDE